MSETSPLHIDFIITDKTPKSRKETLELLAERAAESSPLSAFKPKDLYKRLEKREKTGSTGFGGGIAIPHCAIDGIEEFVLGVLLVKEGVDFSALDNKPVQLFFLIIGPTEQRNRHIKILSAISKMVKDADITDRLLNETELASIEKILREHLQIRGNGKEKEGHCLVSCYVQKEEIFDGLLELIAAEGDGSFTVIETQNGGEFLNRLPLFSSYWSERSSSFNRLIQAIVPKSRCNDLIRKINLIEDTFGDAPGLLVTAQELIHASGSIEF